RGFGLQDETAGTGTASFEPRRAGWRESARADVLAIVDHISDRFAFALDRVPNTPHMMPHASPEAGNHAPEHTPADRAVSPCRAGKRLADRARAAPRRVVVGRGDLSSVTGRQAKQPGVRGSTRKGSFAEGSPGATLTCGRRLYRGYRLGLALLSAAVSARSAMLTRLRT